MENNLMIPKSSYSSTCWDNVHLGMAMEAHHHHNDHDRDHHPHHGHHIIPPLPAAPNHHLPFAIDSPWPSSSILSPLLTSCFNMAESSIPPQTQKQVLVQDHQQGQETETQDEEEEEEEELGTMKEMMYKIAAMQPVDIDLTTIRKPKRKNVWISDDPQSVAARHRRERISEKIRILQRLVPGGTKMDTASMLEEAIRYVKFLKRQIRILQSSHQDQPTQSCLHDWPTTISSANNNKPVIITPSSSDGRQVRGELSSFAMASSSGGDTDHDHIIGFINQ
ncbi:hypothetical protein Dimus_013759 [Dionaea muscipula]